MWHSIFHLPVPVAEKILRTVLIYAVIAVLVRATGKRGLAGLNTLDIVVVVLISNVVQNGIIGNDNSVTGAVVGAAVLFGLHRLFSTLAYRFPWADRMLEGTPSYLIKDGKLVHRTLRHEQISTSQLLSMARRQGFAGLDAVGDAVLETDGSVKFVASGEQYDASAHPPTPARARVPRPPRAA